MFAPTQLFYLVSLACNERCTKCGHWRVRGHPPMIAVEYVVEAVQAVPSATDLCIVGGEPLLFARRLLRILEGIDGTGIRTTIVTNGVRCTRDFLAALTGRNVHLVFSIDTLERTKWQWVRGTNSMDTVLDNFADARRLLEPEQISVQSVLSTETRGDVEAVGRWCQSMGVFHSVQPYVAEGFGGTWQGLVADGQHAAQELEVGPCLAAGRNLSIMPDGSVFTCFQQSSIPASASPIGKLGKQTIQSIIGGRYAREVVERMRRCDLPCKVLKCNR